MEMELAYDCDCTGCECPGEPTPSPTIIPPTPDPTASPQPSATPVPTAAPTGYCDLEFNGKNSGRWLEFLGTYQFGGYDDDGYPYWVMNAPGDSWNYIYLTLNGARWTVSSILGAEGSAWFAYAAGQIIPTEIQGGWMVGDDASNPDGGWWEEEFVSATCVAPFSPTPEPSTTVAPTIEPIEVKTDAELKSAVDNLQDGETIKITRTRIDLTQYVGVWERWGRGASERRASKRRIL